MRWVGHLIKENIVCLIVWKRDKKCKWSRETEAWLKRCRMNVILIFIVHNHTRCISLSLHIVLNICSILCPSCSKAQLYQTQENVNGIKMHPLIFKLALNSYPCFLMLFSIILRIPDILNHRKDSSNKWGQEHSPMDETNIWPDHKNENLWAKWVLVFTH